MATAPAQAFYPHIVKKPGYCGGKAAIDNTRVRVNNVVFLHKEGFSDAQILERYPNLNLAQVHAALTYYYDHQAEIEAEFARDEAWDERYERAKAEHLARKSSR